jgi:hypothetical protein
MKRDLQVNYGNLEAFAGMLSGYLSALDDMRDAVISIDELLESSKGQAATELRACKDDVLAAIDTLSTQASDASEILYLYIRDMTAILHPVGWAYVTRADSNDTYWNITHMAWANTTRANQWVHYGAQDADTKSYNQNITSQISAEATALTSRIDGYLEEMWSLHKLVADYEQTDDSYATQVGTLYDKYTSGWERVADIFEGAGGFITGLVQGLFDGVSSLVIGLFDLVGNVLCYLGSGAAVCAYSLFGATPPAWASEFLDEANATIDALLSDPFLIVEGMGQGLGDSFDEKGIAYGIGTLVPEIVGLKGLGSAARAGRIGNKLDDAADAGRIANGAADVGRLADDMPGAHSVEDILDDLTSGGLHGTARGIENFPYPTVLDDYRILKDSGVLGDKVFTERKTKTYNWVSDTKGYEAALEDFERLGPKVWQKTDPNGTVYGCLPDGTIANVRRSSREKYPTLEVHSSATRQSVKIRY